VTRHSGGIPKLRYKTHRVVDPRHEVITATKVTPGSVEDGDVLREMIVINKETTQTKIDTVVADSRYGSIENYLYCHDVGIKAHKPSLGDTQRGTGSNKGIFPKEEFSYDPERDTYRCPGGQELRKRMYNKRRNTYEYKASSAACAGCALKGAVHEIEGRPNTQTAQEAGRIGQYACCCREQRSEKRYTDPSAPVGAVICLIDTIWVQEDSLAASMEDGDTGLPHCCGSKHHNPDELLE